MVEKKSLVLSFPHNVLQNWIKNLVSLSVTMVLGMPCSLTTSLKKRFAIYVVSSTLWHGMKWATFENLSISTKMESLGFLVFGSPKTKTIEMSTQGTEGMGKCGVKAMRMDS